jgi:hypothetical protein
MKATSFPHGSFVFTCVHPFLRPTSWRDIGVRLKIRFPKIKWFTMVYSHPLDIDNLGLFSSIEIQRFFSNYNSMIHPSQNCNLLWHSKIVKCFLHRPCVSGYHSTPSQPSSALQAAWHASSDSTASGTGSAITSRFRKSCRRDARTLCLAHPFYGEVYWEGRWD